MEFILNKRKMIKKTLLVTSLFLIAIFNLNGQIQKKTIMAGGELDISLETDEYSSFNFALTPTLGYFPIDNLAIGIILETGYLAFDEYYGSSFGIGPLVRYYFGGEKVLGFGHFSYLGSIHSYSNTEENDKSHIVQPGLGISFFILPTIGIQGIASYNYDIIQSDSFIDLRVGFQVYFPPKNPN